VFIFIVFLCDFILHFYSLKTLSYFFSSPPPIRAGTFGGYAFGGLRGYVYNSDLSIEKINVNPEIKMYYKKINIRLLYDH